MSKNDTIANWARIQRQRHLENVAWWKGIVNRQELSDFFGISFAQASTDMQHYIDLNPDALKYSLRQKRYEAASTMKCVLIRPKLEEAAAMFLADDYCAPLFGYSTLCSTGNLFGAVQIPIRDSSEAIERRSVLAILNSLRIRVHFFDTQEGKTVWSWIRPMH